MCTPLACSDYYGTSAPPAAIGRTTDLPTTGPAARRGGRPRTVPTFTTESIDEGGAQLYPDSIATTTPQTFAVASPPDRSNRLRSCPARPTRRRSRAAHRPISVRFEPALDLRGVRQRFLSYAFSSLLAGPGPSDSAGPSRTLSGLLPPSRASPRSGCPQLHRPAATDQRWSPFTSTRFQRLVAHVPFSPVDAAEHLHCELLLRTGCLCWSETLARTRGALITRLCGLPSD